MAPENGPSFEVDADKLANNWETPDWIDTDRIEAQRGNDRDFVAEMEASDPDKAIDEAYQKYVEDAWDWADMSYEEFKEWYQWWADNGVDMETTNVNYSADLWSREGMEMNMMALREMNIEPSIMEDFERAMNFIDNGTPMGRALLLWAVQQLERTWIDPNYLVHIDAFLNNIPVDTYKPKHPSIHPRDMNTELNNPWENDSRRLGGINSTMRWWDNPPEADTEWDNRWI